MTNINIINIYNATESLADKPFSHEEQWSIYKFRKELRNIVDFYKEREKVINDKYIPFADEQGVLKGEKYQEYLKEKQELDNMEAEFNYEKFELSIVDGVTFKTIESLEDFIEFKP